MQKPVNRVFLFTFFASMSFISVAQQISVRSDIEQIGKQLQQPDPDLFRRPYIYKNETSFIRKFNPIGLLLGGTLYVYQNVFSKHLSADCLFTPSCSEFSKQAIKEYGLLKGTLLSIDRVNRCNRIAAQDLRLSSTDAKTNRYPDPVSRHKKSSSE
jgi:uncharacterized protein